MSRLQKSNSFQSWWIESPLSQEKWWIRVSLLRGANWKFLERIDSAILWIGRFENGHAPCTISGQNNRDFIRGGGGGGERRWRERYFIWTELKPLFLSFGFYQIIDKKILAAICMRLSQPCSISTDLSSTKPWNEITRHGAKGPLSLFNRTDMPRE